MEATAYSVELLCPYPVCRACIRNDFAPDDIMVAHCVGCSQVPDGFDVPQDILMRLETRIDCLYIRLPRSWPSEV